MTTQFLKLKKSERINAEQPANKLTWAKHGFSEFFGTIMISLFLAGLATVITKDGKVVEEFFLHNIIVGFYAGFIAVGTVLLIFLRWSCDLNPAVTVYRIITGRNTLKYGFFKLAIQFVGGIVAGLIIYGVGHSIGSRNANNHIVADHAIDALKSSQKVLSGFISANHQGGIAGGATWIFFIEMVMTSILLFPIFSPAISNKYRDVMIMFIISMSVWMGILGGTAAINPARGLAQQIPGLFFGFEASNSSSTKSLVDATIAMIAGGLVAPFFLVLVQEFTYFWFNGAFAKVVEFKNTRAQNMTQPANKNFTVPSVHTKVQPISEQKAKTAEEIAAVDIITRKQPAKSSAVKKSPASKTTKKSSTKK